MKDVLRVLGCYTRIYMEELKKTNTMSVTLAGLLTGAKKTLNTVSGISNASVSLGFKVTGCEIDNWSVRYNK